MAHWVVTIGEILSPLKDLMHKHLISGRILARDESEPQLSCALDEGRPLGIALQENSALSRKGI
jgi:hypothetical protein